MKHLITASIGLTILLMAGGCSMCCGVFDYDYPTYGGRHERVDRQRGRVGSIYSDPNFGAVGQFAPAELQPEWESPSRDGGQRHLNQTMDPSEDVLPDPIPSAPQPNATPDSPQPSDETGTVSTGWRPLPLRAR